jgi:glucose/arabinose dehydrogenase
MPSTPARGVLAMTVALVLAGACSPAADPEPGPSPTGATAPPGPTGPAEVATPTAPAEGATPEEPSRPAGTEPTPEGPVDVVVETVATGLEAPWDVVFDGDRALVTERDSGRILALDGGGGTSEVLRLDVDPSGEGGLLGLVADPSGEGLYAYLTTGQDNRVVRIGADGATAPVLTGIPSGRIHNGGRIAFGPDGHLYVATGDAGTPALSQDPGSLAGKILRVSPDGTVPDDNPTEGSPVYALGLRNPQGLAWTADGALYATEFGPDRDDEVNRIEPGANYGWPDVTGQAGVDGFVDPVFVRQPGEASWSGIAILDGGAIPQWEGDAFVAALRGNRLWRLSIADDGTVAEAEALLGDLGRLRQVVQAPDGSLWVLTSNRDGRGSPADDDDRIVRLGPAR